MGTPPAADDSVCLARNVVRESRAAPPTKIAFQVLRGIDFFTSTSFHLMGNSNIPARLPAKINEHLSIVIFFPKKFSPRVLLEWNIPTKLRESIDKGERRGKSGRRGFQGSRVMSRGSSSRQTSTGFLGANGDI